MIKYYLSDKIVLWMNPYDRIFRKYLSLIHSLYFN